MPKDQTAQGLLTPRVVQTFSFNAINLGARFAAPSGGFQNSGVLGGSNVFLYPAFITEPYRIQRLFVINGSVAAGNSDVGVYDDAGALLVSAGSTAMTGTLQAQTWTVDYTLSPGRFWIAFGNNSTTAQFPSATNIQPYGSLPGFAQHIGTSVPLPSTITPAANVAFAFPLFGISRGTLL